MDRDEAVEHKSLETTTILTVDELASYLRVHPSTVYRLLKTGQLPAFRVGSDWRFNLEAIDQWRLEREKKQRV
jgi:excisionase family DNA binding protein